MILKMPDADQNTAPKRQPILLLSKTLTSAFERYVFHPDTFIQAGNRFTVTSGVIVLTASIALALILEPFLAPFFLFQAVLGFSGLIKPLIKSALDRESYITVCLYAFFSPMIFWLLVGPQANLVLYIVVTTSVSLLFFRWRDYRSVGLICLSASAAFITTLVWQPAPLITVPPGYENYARSAIDGFIIGYLFVFALLANDGYNASETLLRKARDELKNERDRARAASRAREEFLAMISHEFRTPLTTLIATTKVLGKRDDAITVKNELETIEASSQSLLLFFENALDHARYSSGKFIPVVDDTDLRALARDVISVLSIDIKKKSLVVAADIAPSCPPAVVSDPTLLRQVLLNLVSNAIKYTEQGRIDIRFDTTPVPGATRLRIEVQDTGVGIPADQQGKLFDLFSRDTQQNRKASGIGLGLAVCKRIIETLDGEIGVESAPGAGSLFWIEVPLTTVDQADDGAPPMEHISLEGLSLLLIEDHPFNRIMLKEQLEDEGLVVTDVGDTASAMAAVQNRKYDVIVTDIFLSDASGFDFAEKYRTHDEQTPIIALSASANPEDHKRCHAAGMDGVLTKPLSIPAFRRVASNSIARRKNRQTSTITERQQ